MHLNDQQLLELSDENKHHLEQCKECSLRAKNLIKIRDQFNALPTVEMPNKNWQAIKEQFESQQVIAKPRISAFKFWQVASLTIAASALLMIYMPSVNMLNAPELNKDQQLANLILENNQLQQQLFESLNEKNNQPIDVALMQSELSLIDLSIQQAYLEEGAIDDLSKLWTQRLALMKNQFSRQSSQSSVNI
ncbi:hypothetical protein Q4493_06915 [Colwellia sp. 1_MG-2023]|uniref:hypothetical protein n=1 Tax=Colwellia sp. 1_MG-2023 TaxID=3062649 RepID=UPI0026E1CE1C|nr:hypothetical protein [Colwellia sp. 1_MG-2023]MDO6445509.1 hypothetical protein [Colwellia sp. 1_MG-2023]